MTDFDPRKMWDYYQGEAPETFDGAKGRLRFVLSRIPPSARSVLNIGVGSAWLEKIAIERGLDVYTLDPSERAIDQLKDDLKLGDHARVGSIASIPFPNGTFDAVVVSEVLEHLDDRTLAAAVPELHR